MYKPKIDINVPDMAKLKDGTKSPTQRYRSAWGKDKIKFNGLENRIPKENTKISIIHSRIKLKRIFEMIRPIGENGETRRPSREFE